MKNNILISGLCAALISSTFAHAEAPKKSLGIADVVGDSNIVVDAAIAFVDSFAIMGECQEGKKARKDIESKRDLATQEIQADVKSFEKAKSDYVAQSSTLSDSAREKKEKELMKMERDLKNIVAEKEEELKHDMQVATETLAQNLEAGITELAKKQDLDIVLDKTTGRAIYVSPKFDFTQQAIAEVDKKYEIKLAQAKKADTTVKVADNKAGAAKPAKVGA